MLHLLFSVISFDAQDLSMYFFYYAISITTEVEESKVDNVMTMKAQEIIRALREGGEQVDVTASQVTRAPIG